MTRRTRHTAFRVDRLEGFKKVQIKLGDAAQWKTPGSYSLHYLVLVTASAYFGQSIIHCGDKCFNDNRFGDMAVKACLDIFIHLMLHGIRG